jgi:hypothetical protein
MGMTCKEAGMTERGTGMTEKMGTIHRAPTLGKIKDKEKTGLMN